MLAQKVVARYSGKVRYVCENYGESKLAERFGVKHYPAVFIDDVLVAKPRDFGYFGDGKKGGRYSPWRNAKSQDKFKADLIRMVDLVLAGKKEQLSHERGQAAGGAEEIARLPPFALTDLSGHPLTEDQMAGRAVVVEFWATWCPPCRSTLEWLASLKRQYGDRVVVLALAVESPETDVRKAAGSLSTELRWAISDAKTALAFGDIVSVPTLFLFDRSGNTARVLYGAPPDLHAQAEKVLATLVN